MNTIIRIPEVLFEKYGYYVPLKEIGYESYLFYDYKVQFIKQVKPLEKEKSKDYPAKLVNIVSVKLVK